MKMLQTIAVDECPGVTDKFLKKIKVLLVLAVLASVVMIIL